jgi:hypothetical protein
MMISEYTFCDFRSTVQRELLTDEVSERHMQDLSNCDVSVVAIPKDGLLGLGEPEG